MNDRKNYQVSNYVAGKSKVENATDRLLVLTWKGNKTTGREAHSARCISVPGWVPQLAGEDREFIDMLIDAFQERQKKIAHTYVSEWLDQAGNNGMCNTIPADVISPESVLENFQNEDVEDGSRGKLSSDQIKGWYEEKLKEVVIFTLASKKGWMVDSYQLTEAEEKQLVQASNGYRATLERLAAPSPRVDMNTAGMLKRAVELLPVQDRENDLVARKLVRKLDAILCPKKESEITLDSL